jgi:hypothetical protein
MIQILRYRLSILYALCLFCYHPLEALLDVFSISGSPSTFTIAEPSAGSQPATITNSSTTYAVISLLGGRRITGQISSNMPAGLTLTIMLQANAPAVSSGTITMTTVAQNLVTGIPILLSLSLARPITYTLNATLNAAPVTNGSVTVTYTLTS